MEEPKEDRTHMRGFASLEPEKRFEAASKGGRAAQAKGTAHRWTSETARAAGKKGNHLLKGRKHPKKPPKE